MTEEKRRKASHIASHLTFFPRVPSGRTIKALLSNDTEEAKRAAQIIVGTYDTGSLKHLHHQAVESALAVVDKAKKLLQPAPLKSFSCPISDEEMNILNGDPTVEIADATAQTIVERYSIEKLYEILHVAHKDNKQNAIVILIYHIDFLEREPDQILKMAAQNQDLMVLETLINMVKISKSTIIKIGQIANEMGYGPEFQSMLQSCKNQFQEKKTHSLMSLI